MSKGEYDEYERKFGNLNRSITMMRLSMKKGEVKEMLRSKYIDFATYKEEIKLIDDEMEKLGKVAEETKMVKLDDDSEYETNVATYSIAEKLHLTVFDPEMKDGKIQENEKGEPIFTQYPTSFWIIECEETMFNKLSDLVDYMQMYGAEEPITIFDNIAQLFEPEIIQLRQAEMVGEVEDTSIPVSEIIKRITNLKTEYATGEIYQKKSESAYGVRIRGMKSVRDVGNANSTTSD